jgi:hypothetical protein
MTAYNSRLSWKNTAILTGIITFMFSFMPVIAPYDYRKFPVKKHATNIDGDGFSDSVYVADTSDRPPKKYKLMWKRGLGDGSFEKEGKTIGIYASHKPEGVLVNDFTGDGKPDIVYYIKRPYARPNWPDSYVFEIMEGNGDGTFEKPAVKWKFEKRPAFLN